MGPAYAKASADKAWGMGKLAICSLQSVVDRRVPCLLFFAVTQLAVADAVGEVNDKSNGHPTNEPEPGWGWK